MATPKPRAIGTSVAVFLPKELLAKLDLREGDAVHAVEAPDGLRRKRADPDFERQMAAARDVMRRRRAVLRELAK
jgi:putative addiction module antidote